jgi:hypothetical protein
MPIPPFTKHGLLPQGIHDCTWNELAERFGSFQSSDRRPQLCRKLEKFIGELRRVRLGRELIIDGSFVTDKLAPNDIDLILLLSIDHDDAADLRPDEYNLLSKTRVRSRFGFDIFVVGEGSRDYVRTVDFFSQVRDAKLRKGLLRFRL